ncbi:uncharacterized protein LOC132639573 [Lycium barbarum]|uniref:uncharacterized protein LOC132639573 n=1 Tax=Lycium barbarum TaxID=112863 RepID=UPI00293EF188|nr:uncharacterized protein LOC132639573 [Lycium barbarum]
MIVAGVKRPNQIHLGIKNSLQSILTDFVWLLIRSRRKIQLILRKKKKVRGPTLLKEIWKLPPGNTIAVQFNSRNQAIKKDGRKLESFLGFVARTPELTPLHIHDWRSFDKDEKKKLVEFVRKKFSIPTHGEEFVIKSIGKKWKDYKCDLKSVYLTKFKTKDVLLKNKPNRIPRDQWTGLVSYWVSEKAKRRSQTNINNRAKQKMPHTGGSKSIATLMDEKDMINEKLCNSEGSNEQPPRSVAWEGDVYCQVLGNEKTGYVRGLGLGPTPSVLWGSRSFGNNVEEDSSNEIVKRLEQEVTKLKDINGKQNEELSLVKQNQEKLLSELAWLRKAMSRNAPNELSIHQNINGISDDQVPDAKSGHERGQQSPHMLFKGQSVAENIPSSHGIILLGRLQEVVEVVFAFGVDK